MSLFTDFLERFFPKPKLNEEKVEKIIEEADTEKSLLDDSDWTVINPEKFGFLASPNVNAYLKEYIEWVYACVNAKAEAVSNIEFKLFRYKKSGVDEVLEHPVLELLENPNPNMTRSDFIFHIEANLCLTGEMPLRIRKNNPKNLKELPSELWPLSPANLKVNVGKTKDSYEMIKNYVYMQGVGDEITFNPWEIIFFKNSNPKNPWRGVGVIEAAARSIDILNYSETYNLNFFRNSAVPYTVLMSDQKLNENTIKRLKTSWNSNYGGFKNAFKTAILEQGLKIEKIQQTARDMDYLEQQKFLRDKLLAMFNIPKVILGIVEDANRANAETSEYIYNKYSVKPEMQKIVDYFNQYLMPIYDKKGELFLDFVDPVTEDKALKVTEYSAAVDKWMTKNEIRDLEGLEPLDGGDEIWQPLMLSPMGYAPEPETVNQTEDNTNATENSTDEENPEEKPEEEIVEEPTGNKMIVKYRVLRPKKTNNLKKFSRQISKLINRNVLVRKSVEELENQLKKLIKIHLAKKNNKETKEPKYKGIKHKDFYNKENIEKFSTEFVKKVDNYEKLLINHLKSEVYSKQEVEILANIEKRGVKFFPRKNEKAITKKVGDEYMFDEDVYVKISTDELKKILLEVIKEQGLEASELLGVGFEYSVQEEARKWLNQKPLKASKSMNDTIYQRVRKSLADGISEGEGVPKLSKRVTEIYADLEKYQANNIARSEVSRAANFATIDAYKQSGVVEGKQWVIAGDDRTCEFCLQAETDFNNVPIEDTMLEKGSEYTGASGGILKIDYENIEEPPLHASCRCTTIPILAPVKSTKPNKNIESEAEKLLADIDKELYGQGTKTEGSEKKDSGANS